jgi:23S rRNA pseudouridine2605 synthase
MLAAVGHRVVMLHRDSFGPIALGDLEEGSWRSLTAAEVASLSTITEGR